MGSNGADAPGSRVRAVNMMGPKRVAEAIQFAFMGAEDAGTVKGFQIHDDEPREIDGAVELRIRVAGREFSVLVTEVAR